MLYFEHKHLYRRIKGEVPDDRYTTPFGKARVHRKGDDLTVITWGAMVYTADEAAAKLADEGVSVEVLDLRTLIPWDRDAVLESVARCSKALVLHEDTKTGGFGAEIAATIAEEAFEQLDAPVRRIAAPDAPGPVCPVAREGIHPAGRRRRGRAPRAGRVLGGHVSTGTQVEVVMPQMGVSVAEGTITRWLKQLGEHRRARRDAARDLDRQGRHRGAEPRRRRPRRDPRPGGRDRRGRDRAGGHRAGGGSPADAETASETRARGCRIRAASRDPHRGAPSRTAQSPYLRRRPRRLRTLRQPQPEAAGNGRTFVSPVVARIAAEHGVDPGGIPGTGQGGRVTKKDILAFIESGAAAAAAPAADAPAAAEPPSDRRSRRRASPLQPRQLRRAAGPHLPPRRARPCARPSGTRAAGGPIAGEQRGADERHATRRSQSTCAARSTPRRT